MSEFFVNSKTGTDTGDGSLRYPFKTVQRFQEFIDAGRFGYGDKVRFDGTFYSPLPILPNMRRRGLATMEITSYNEIAKFIGLKLIRGGWTLYQPNVWVVNLAATDGTIEGYTSASGQNIAKLLVDGVIKGNGFTTINALSEQWDFYSDPPVTGGTHRLFVYSIDNPALMADDIGASVNADGFTAREGSRLHDVSLLDFGGHGVQLRHRGREIRDIKVYDNFIERFGGARQDAGLGDRFGNGIQSWMGTHDTYLARNYIADGFDCGITWQGDIDEASGYKSFENHEFVDNKVERVNQGIELWGRQDATEGGFINIDVHRNLFKDSGKSWGAKIRRDKNKGAQILTYRMTLPVQNVRIHDNTFDGIVDYYRYHDGLGDNDNNPVGLEAYNNVVIGRRDSLIQWGKTETLEQHAAWVAREGVEQDTTWVYDNDSVADVFDVTARALTVASSAKSVSHKAAEPTPVPEFVSDGAGYFRPGRWYVKGRSETLQGTVFNTQGLLAGPVIPARDRAAFVDSLGSIVSSASGAGGVITFAAFDLVNGEAYRIANLGSASATSTGTKSVSAVASQLKVGAHDLWLAVVIRNPNSPGVALNPVPSLRAATGLTDEWISGSNLEAVANVGANGLSYNMGDGDIPEYIAAPVSIPLTPIVGFKTR